ncbi:MAG: AMP-binding protein [Gammaproteobacteria bacterium]|nr:AMP-binding protein [Gammaproteobacteria bacterium]
MTSLPRVHATVVHMLADAAERWPEREALVCGTDRLSYGEYLAAVAEFAHELCQLGARDERVALLMGNSVELCIAMFAAHAAGAEVVPLNPLYTASELRPILDDAKPRVLVHDEHAAPVVAKVMVELDIPHVRLVTPAAERQGSTGVVALPEPLPGPDTLATLQYTGGTTGISKGVNLSHRNIAVNISQREALLPTGTNGERILCVLPLFHIYGVAMCLHNAVYAGATLVILPRYTAEAAFALLAGERISILAGSPTVFVGLMADAQFATMDFADLSLSYSGASALPGALLRKWEDATGAPVLEGYGQSESGPVISFNPLNGVRKPGSVGLVLPDTRLEIVDPVDGTTVLGAAHPGEIRISGPQVMCGYRNRAEETAGALRDGWLYTGDIGELDVDGYLFIRDRKKDMILVSGYNVYPREIEEVLHRHPDVLEAAVVGVIDEYRGESVHAYVAPAPDCALDAVRLDAYCREHLASYKVPRRYDFVDALPKTGVGKVDKMALRTLANAS